jgi:hypothetical protein
MCKYIVANRPPGVRYFFLTYTHSEEERRIPKAMTLGDGSYQIYVFLSLTRYPFTGYRGASSQTQRRVVLE